MNRNLRTSLFLLGACTAGCGPEHAESLSQNPTLGAGGTLPLGAVMPESMVPLEQQDEVLDKGWKGSKDIAWTTSGDANGFHLLVAREREAYAWRTVASLREPGMDVDAWIGNACLTASGRRAVVAYAPRSFAAKPELSERGAFVATVDIESGHATKLPLRSSLAYFSPGCGDGERAVITQERSDESSAGGRMATRLFILDAESGKVARPIEMHGQITSTVPVAGGAMVGVAGRQLLRMLTVIGFLRPICSML